MTKPYHLTQDEAEAIATSTIKLAPCLPISYEELATIINAALDEVLGEPILFASPLYDELLERHNGHTLCGGKKSELHTLALYAPRR